MITHFPLYFAPFLVKTPVILFPSLKIFIASSCTRYKLFSFSRTLFISSWYFLLSACTLKEWTAGPFEVFNILDWIKVLSIFFAISPPNASISRTRWPLPVPPIFGLQLICAIESKFIHNNKVLTPSLADARAASLPAWPAPITIVSNSPASK